MPSNSGRMYELYVSCNLFFRTFIFCDLCNCYLLLANGNILFAMFKCYINFQLCVKCYGLRFAMYFNAPRDLVLLPFLFIIRFYLNRNNCTYPL